MLRSPVVVANQRLQIAAVPDGRPSLIGREGLSRIPALRQGLCLCISAAVARVSSLRRRHDLTLVSRTQRNT